MSKFPIGNLWSKLAAGVLKTYFKYLSVPGMISLGGGLPHPSKFPFTKIELRTSQNQVLTFNQGGVDNKQEEEGKGEEMEDLGNHHLHLQYSRGCGMVQLQETIVDHMRVQHSMDDSVHSCCVNVGSTDATAKILLMLDAEPKVVLVDAFTYSSLLEQLETFGFEGRGVERDEEGMSVEQLRMAVEEEEEKSGLTPRLLYLIPTGQNPQGHTMSEERKDDIYEYCVEKGIAIIEDDSYYYLHLGEDGCEVPGLDNLPPSFLSRDKEGIVIRMDSLSKSFAPGCRLGWITGDKELIDKFQLFNEISCQFPSGFSQSFVTSIFQTWGHEGLATHMKGIQEYYRNQRNLMLEAATSHCGDLLEFEVPEAGMFMWFRLSHFNTISSSNKFVNCRFKVKGVSCTQSLFPYLIEEKVLVIPGQAFHPSHSPSPFLRATFATATGEEFNEAFRRIGEGIRKFLNDQKVN